MNYAKLTAAITVGILLAAVIIVAVIELPEYLRQRRIQERLARFNHIEHMIDCVAPTACIEEKYAKALEVVVKKLASVPQAAHGFCVDTAWTGAAPDRLAQLLAECDAATQARLVADLK